MFQRKPNRVFNFLSCSSLSCLSNGYTKEIIEIHHQVGLEIAQTDIDTVIGVIPKKQELAVYDMFTEQAYTLLKPDGYFILSSTSTVITRLISLASKKSRFEVLERMKNKGRSVVILQKRDSK